MRRLLAALLLIVAGPAMALSPPFLLTTGVDDGGGFIQFADSSYGPGAVLAEDDLTDRLPQWYPVGDPDFTGWNTTTLDTPSSETSQGDSTSTRDDVQDLLSCGAGDENERIVLPASGFDVMRNYPAGGNVWTIGTDCDGIVVQGRAGTEIRLKPSATDWFETMEGDTGNDPTHLGYDDNVDTRLFSLESVPSSPLESCSIVGGMGLNSRVIELSSGCTVRTTGGTAGDDNWGTSSIVRITISDFSNASGSGAHEVSFRATCVDGNLFSSDKAGSDCSLISGDNDSGQSPRIQLDWPLPMDYTADPYAFTISTITAELMERKGSSGFDTDQIRENIWFDGLHFDNSDTPFVQDSIIGAFRFTNCFECGVINSDFDPHSTILSHDSGVTRLWHAHNVFRGPNRKANCIAQIESITNTNPITVRFTAEPDDSNGGTTELCSMSSGDASGDVIAYISSGASEPSLRNRLVRITGYSYDGSGFNVATLSVDQVPQSECTGGGAGTCSTAAGGYISVTDHFGSTTVWNSSGSDVQVVDNTFVSAYGLMTMQNGTVRSVFAYNYSTTPLEDMWWRGYFKHGDGNGAAGLMEGNHVEGFTLRATSTQAPGEGIGDLYLYNRLTHNGIGTALEGTDSIGDINFDRGTLECHENTSLDEQENATTEFLHFIGNVLRSSCSAGSQTGIDWYATGDGIPGNLHAYFSKNRAYNSFNLDSIFNSNNTTTLNRDSKDVGSGLNVYGLDDDLDESDTVPAGWSTWVWPSSALFDAAASRADWVDGQPPWSCEENDSFGEWIGAHVDDMTTGGVSGVHKLPAQLRYEDDCTPRVAGYGPPE